MVFNHRVKFNGILYEVGQDVPMEEVKAENKANIKPQEVLKTKVEEVKEEVAEIPTYSKTEINRMSTAELKELALANGVESAEEMTGAELKKCLISAFCL